MQSDYKDTLYLSTEYRIYKSHVSNASGQVRNIRRFEGQFPVGGDKRSQYTSHQLVYEQNNRWQRINTGNVGCHQSTKPPFNIKLIVLSMNLPMLKLK